MNKSKTKLSIERNHCTREIVISVSIPEDEWNTIVFEAKPAAIDGLDLFRLNETQLSNIFLALFLFFLGSDRRRDGDSFPHHAITISSPICDDIRSVRVDVIEPPPPVSKPFETPRYLLDAPTSVPGPLQRRRRLFP